MKPIRRVVVAFRVAKERSSTVGRVVGAGCEADERIITLHGIIVRQAGVLTSRSRLRRKCKACEREQRERGMIILVNVFMSLCPFIVLLRDLPVEVSENLSEMEKL